MRDGNILQSNTYNNFQLYVCMCVFVYTVSMRMRLQFS
jgi:hypothetical protein